jgi:hypothetical protein
MKRFTKSPTHADRSLPRTQLDLTIAGFAQQDVVSVTDIVNAIDRLPQFHLEGLRSISYEPELDYAMAPPGQRLSRCAEFIQRQRKINVYYFDNPRLLWQILYHEIGHYVFFLIISSQVKKLWVTDIHPRSVCITDYAAVNAQEDFAECYAAYLLNPAILRELPEKFAFIQDLVFSGASGTLKERNKIGSR